MNEDLTDLRGAGWKRLLGAARRNLERTGGALDHSIGLNSPSEAGRRLVIGITGSYRPQTGRCILAGGLPAWSHRAPGRADATGRL